MKKNENSAAATASDYLYRSMFTRTISCLLSQIDKFKYFKYSQIDKFKYFKYDDYLEESDEEDYRKERQRHLKERHEMEKEVVLEIEKETHRLAVVNMNWRVAKAADLYALFYSLVAPDGPIKIKSVAIYPTDFGLGRIKEIRQQLVEHQQYADDTFKNLIPYLMDRYGEDESHYDQMKIDQWKTGWPSIAAELDLDDEPCGTWPNVVYENDEKNRFFFAMVECDSCATALEIYKQNDGHTFEPDAIPLDLRFIPDDMNFQHPPKDVATVESLTPSLVTRYSQHLLARDRQRTNTRLKLFFPY